MSDVDGFGGGATPAALTAAPIATPVAATNQVPQAHIPLSNIQSIYREADDPAKPKSVALRRELDWISGLSFSTIVPVRKPYVIYDVQTLRANGYAVRFDGGQAITDLHTRQPPDPQKYPTLQRVFGKNHVSVYLPDMAEWDKWYQAEQMTKAQQGGVSIETLRLWGLRKP